MRLDRLLCTTSLMSRKVGKRGGSAAHLYTYGDGVRGWGLVSSTTGAVGELVRWATVAEAES